MTSKACGASLLAVLLLLTFGCRAKTSSGVAHSKAQDETSAESHDTTAVASNVVKLDGRMMKSIEIKELSENPMPMLLTATGKVQFNEDQMARIIAPVSGQVLRLNVKVGDIVRKGETLFFMNSREAAAAITDHLESHRDVELAEKIHAMTQDLVEHQAASRISLQQAESELAKAKARLARSEEALQVLGFRIQEIESGGLTPRIPIRATVGGTIIERRVTEGQFVQPDSNPLLMIADLSTVWILADIFERNLHLVKTGQKAEVTTAAYPGQRFVARVSRVSDVVDPTTRTVKVRFLVSNPEGRLKPEMFAYLTLFLNESALVLTVPAKAVFTEGGRHFVFVWQGEKELARRQVEIAPAASNRERVLSGLKPGEKVVTNGALLLRQQESRKESY